MILIDQNSVLKIKLSEQIIRKWSILPIYPFGAETSEMGHGQSHGGS